MHSVALIVVETTKRSKIAGNFALTRSNLQIVVTKNNFILVVYYGFLGIFEYQLVVERYQQTWLVRQGVGLESCLGVSSQTPVFLCLHQHHDIVDVINVVVNIGVVEAIPFVE